MQMLVISLLFRISKTIQFSGDLVHAILIDETAQNQLFGNAIQIANNVGYKDIHFDFELLHPEDRSV